MKKPLKKINVAGTWNIEVSVELHSTSVGAIGEYIMELNEAIKEAAIKIGNKDKHEVNVKLVGTRVNSGI